MYLLIVVILIPYFLILLHFVKLIYLPYSKERPTMADGHSSKAFLNSDVREKMLQRVERSNLLVLELESSGVVVVNGN